MGDYAYSAEDLLVWVYEMTESPPAANWIETDQVVPDQVTPASDTIPSNPIVNGNAGVSTEYSRGDHQHPLQVSTVLLQQDTATGEVGTAVTYARSDHTYHVNLSSSVPLKDTGTGTARTDSVYASATHYHPLNVDPSSVIVPLVNATVAANGTSDYYCRNDHVYSQQLTYDGNIIATKFIKTGGLPTEVLCANGYTTTIDAKLSLTYSAYNSVQIIRLQHYYTVNGINTVYGVFTAPTRVTSYYLIDNGANQLFHNHSGSRTSAIYSAYVRLESAGNVTIVVSDQSTYYTNRITEILTQDVVSRVSNGTQIPINYDLANGGIINNKLQVNPTGRTYTKFNNAIDTTRTGQWEISKTSDIALTINPTSLRQTDHSVVNVGTDQTITGRKTFGGTTLADQNIDSRGLMILADGNTLSFNGSVIAGTGTTNGATVMQ
ncbi:MAG: hypothetical protein EZS28_002485 [Streblomastix strix]|uniref:Uncharacterized protein n=1 Tax=Streblomastix strix TaxID=222440 RepID=A0A5J4X5A5_9EUKA|nr:MAG: hypothetical protein EZS28_002485 [Streblomastix strix]